MCGLVAIYGYDNSGEIAINAGIQIKHRGPDASGFWTKDDISFSHQRLSIIDLDKRSNQPFQKNNKVIIFNGEIYNYKEIRKDLALKNVSFNTESDTEVILEAYNIYGKDCLNFFRGMFSFVIYDELTGSSFIARDHFGIKPLYFYPQIIELLSHLS